ncbi:DNA polymerase [uncultured archaeon]|nr:DNA polymerase [uncultured archaeon]
MVNNKLSGILLDCDYRVAEDGFASIHVFISTESGIKLFEDRNFRPYFYIVSKSPRKTISAMKDFTFGNGAKCFSAEEAEKSNCEGVVKVEFRNPQELVACREKITDVEGVVEKREFDIPFANRYLIDRGLKPMHGVEVEYEEPEKQKNGPGLGPPRVKSIRARDVKHELRVVALDIETLSPGRFSDPKKDPILMIVLAQEKSSAVYTYKPTNKKNTVVLKSEEEMIEKALLDLREYSPDVIVTYNGDSFDLPYIKTRCEKLGIKCDLGFGGITATNRGIFHSATLRGTQHLDAFGLVKFMTRIGSISLLKMDLESVSEKLFNKPKEKVGHEDINKSWGTGEIDRVIDYNREDGEVTLRLAQEFLPLQLQLCSMLRYTLADTSRASSSEMVEQLLIVNSFERNALIPNKPSEAEVHQRSLQTYEGGFVKEPIPGLHENIAVLDFRSLHPTIMISHNVSLETLKCGHASCRNGKNVSPDKDWFCEMKIGFLAGILEEILKERIELKKKAKSLEKDSSEYKMANAKQHALKILLNSHYGYLGYPRARWYSRESARAVTAWSRQYIQEVSGKAEEAGFNVIYNDTDSSFLVLPKGKTEEDVKMFLEKTNSELPDAMELEFDGLYRRGIFVTKRESGTAAKKKYALIDFKGNLKIVGFEYVRRDWAPIAKETQKQVIEAVLKEGKPEKAIQITKDVIKRLKSGAVPKKELVIMKQLKARPSKYESIGPHVAAAQKAMDRGKEVEVGSLIGFVVTRKGKSVSDRAELEEYVKEGDYDTDYYLEHQILPAVLNIMQELGYSKEDLVHGGKQSTLFGPPK